MFFFLTFLLKGTVWTFLGLVNDYKLKFPNNYFDELLKKQPSRSIVDQIEKDLKRTFPTHVQFKEDIGQKSLYRVLHAFSLHNPNVGYCQGMVNIFIFIFYYFVYLFFLFLIFFKKGFCCCSSFDVHSRRRKRFLAFDSHC
jgi:hypothetical protein